MRTRCGARSSTASAAWNTVIDKIKGPLNTILDFIEKHFVQPLNAMLGAVGIDPNAFKIPDIPQFAAGGLAGIPTGAARHAVGGTVGGYSPHSRADNIPAWLTAGEFVLPVSATNALRAQGGDQLLESLRSGVLGHADGGLVRGYADGGSVWDAITSGFGLGGSLSGTALGQVATAVTGDPLGAIKSFVSSLLGGLGSGVFPEMAKGALTKVGDGLAAKVQSLLAAVTGGGLGTAVNVGAGQVSVGGRLLDATTAGIFEKASAALGGLSLLQGSWSNAVGASGGTHSGSGAMDVWPLNGDWRRAVDVIRADGGIAWHRTPSQGPWAEHIHSITPGIPGLSAAAQAQVGNFQAGLNGLVSNGPDNNGYGYGGVIKPILFDSGNVAPPGLFLGENRTGGPERLTRGDGTTVHQTFNIPQSDPYLIAAESARRMLMGV